MTVSANEIGQMIENVSKVLGRKLTQGKEFEIEDGAHQPKRLPEGYAAVYAFIHKDRFLKIGKVGRKSGARYTSQHYNPNANGSTLAKSLCEDKNISEGDVREWILKNTRRIDILVKCGNSEDYKWTTTLIEAILQYQYRPKYEK